MSEGQQPKGRARGRAWGRARGVPTAAQQQQQSQQRLQPQQQQSPQQRLQPQQQQSPQQLQSPQPQYQLPGTSSQQLPLLPQPQQQPRASARARGHVPKQVQPGPSGVQQMRQQQEQQQIMQQQEQQQQAPEEGACAFDPEIALLSGNFNVLTIGDAKPGKRRGALRGRLDINAEPPIKTRPENLSEKTGTMGTKIKFVTNYFRLTQVTRWSLYQYRVDFSPEEERTKVRRELMEYHKDTLGEAFIFDGSMLFCIQKLHPNVNNRIELFTRRGPEQPIIRITIRFTNELLFGDYQYIQLYNIILRNCLGLMQFQLVGRDYFDPDNSMSIKGYGLEIWPGYSTSILQFENNIMMGIDVSHKVLRCDNALDILKECKKRYGSEWKKYYLDTMLGAVVFTFYNNKPYRVDDVAFDMAPTDTFSFKGRDITYVEYVKEKYGVVVNDFTQPLLISRPKARDIRGGRDQNIILIPQFCSMTGLTDEMRSNFNLMRTVADHTRVVPGKRIESYNAFMRRLTQCSEAMEKLVAWNIQFSQKLEEVPGRVFGSEILYMARNQTVTPRDGDWSREIRHVSMFSSVRLDRWVLVISRQAMFDKRNNRDNVKYFTNQLITAANSLLFDMNKPEVVPVEVDKISSYISAIDQGVGKGGMRLVMCVINGNRSDLYAAIKKKCVCDRPIPSQVIASKTLGHKNLLSVCTKIVIQLNCKLGGSPWFTPVPFKDTIVLPDGTLQPDTQHATMIVGFDVCHDTRSKGKSVGAMVASLDYNFSRFYSSVSRHGLGEELSNDIATHISHAVIRFQEINKYPPPKIVIFRDGVGESNIKYVKEHEILTIKGRLCQMFPNNTPKLTVIIVSKRIQTRLFKVKENKYINPEPGSIVDDVITQPEKYDFFLVSQSVRQGTVTPTNYNVIFDDSKMKPDHVQRMAYKMCHLYYNCTTTVRVPCQVQYAHKLAFLIGQVIHIPPGPEMDHLLYFL